MVEGGLNFGVVVFFFFFSRLLAECYVRRAIDHLAGSWLDW